MSVSFEQYLNEVERQAAQHPEWRRGQTHFNVLAANRGDLAQQVRGSIRDPFHQNAVIPQYLAWLTEQWDRA